MAINVSIPNKFADVASGMVNSAIDQAIQKLADHFNFSPEEAHAYLDQINLQPELLTAKDLPFCGERIPGCCNGLSFRCGLFTQCPKKPQQDGLCRACWTQHSETGSLKYGTIDDRLAKPPMEFADGKVAPFARLMAKNGWTKEYVETSAKALGWTVPIENFVVIKTKRNPKKMESRPLPPIPVEEDAEDALKSDLVKLGVLPAASVSPSKVPDELDEEPVTEPEPKPSAGEPEPTQDSKSDDEEQKRGRKTRDYSKLTTEEVPHLNPSTLRTACTAHGIEVEGKKPATLRVELINHLSFVTGAR
jgi:hypothetical protein